MTLAESSKNTYELPSGKVSSRECRFFCLFWFVLFRDGNDISAWHNMRYLLLLCIEMTLACGSKWSFWLDLQLCRKAWEVSGKIGRFLFGSKRLFEMT